MPQKRARSSPKASQPSSHGFLKPQSHQRATMCCLERKCTVGEQPADRSQGAGGAGEALKMGKGPPIF